MDVVDWATAVPGDLRTKTVLPKSGGMADQSPTKETAFAPPRDVSFVARPLVRYRATSRSSLKRIVEPEDAALLSRIL